ncbi:MAG: hypothetical protein ACLVL6_05990 [Clostridium paraputrificum]|uniref:hypothetical protein n=1 Tax=Clostridium paraputrificum TaxID=29363 RepID=UPI000EA05469|nr:hypothetical protein [Clostridium paraputrificum]RKI48027.1 hypothetical protein D7V67_08850 [Clostridium paraputrificum]
MVSIKKLKKIVKKEIIRKNVGDKAPTHPKLVKPIDWGNKQHPQIHPSNTQNKSKVMESNQIVKKIRKGE